MLLRFIVLVGYVVAFGALSKYVQEHPPRYEGGHVREFDRFGQALLRMWGPLVWPLPALLWIRMLPIPVLLIISLSFFIPLTIFVIFLTIVDVTESSVRPVSERLYAFFPAVLAAFCTLLIFMLLLLYAFPFWQFAAFLIFVTAPPVLAIFSLLWVSPGIIPVNPEQPKRTFHIVRHLTGFFTGFPKPSWIVEDGEVKMRIKGNASYGVGPGWLMTEPENLVVLKDGTTIKRVVGPETLFTEKSESPHQIIDLRNQIRVTRVDARTQDGIEVNLPISSLFRIDAGHKTITLESLRNQESWPYRNKRDIFQIVFHAEVDPTGKTPLEAHQVRPWDDIPLKAAINRVKQVIPEYGLEQLYDIVPDSGAIDAATGKVIPETGTLTRSSIGARVRETVKATVEPLGFQILGGGVGNKILPTNPDVVKQRVEIWKARWISRVMDWENEAQMQNLKDLSHIRSDARVELLSQILEQTSPELENGGNASRYVAYHLLENLLHLARNSQVKELLPERALPILTQLQVLTKEE